MLRVICMVLYGLLHDAGRAAWPLFGALSRHYSAYSIGEWESMRGSLVSFC